MHKRKKKNNNYPYANEVKRAKDDFKRMIDDMSDYEFTVFSIRLTEFFQMLEDKLEEEFDDEGFYEDEFWESELDEENYFDGDITDEDLPF